MNNFDHLTEDQKKSIQKINHELSGRPKFNYIGSWLEWESVEKLSDCKYPAYFAKTIQPDPSARINTLELIKIYEDGLIVDALAFINLIFQSLKNDYKSN